MHPDPAVRSRTREAPAPLPVVAWHTEVGKKRPRDLHQGDEVLVYGRLIRRFYRSGARARSLAEVVANGLKYLESGEQADPDDQRDAGV